jgi:protein SMG8
MYKKYLNKLEDDCLKIWKSGRQLCELVSLTGHPCVHELHRVDETSPECGGDAIKSHSSNIRTVAASNCGFHQSERIDPFDLKQANYTFYNELYTDGKDKRLLKFEFPVFKPSSATVRCGTTAGTQQQAQHQHESSSNPRKDDATNADNDLLNLSVTNLSQEDLNDDDDALIDNDEDDFEDDDASLQSSAKLQGNVRNKEALLLGKSLKFYFWFGL